jgi:hypothetical protein
MQGLASLPASFTIQNTGDACALGNSASTHCAKHAVSTGEPRLPQRLTTRDRTGVMSRFSTRPAICRVCANHATPPRLRARTDGGMGDEILGAEISETGCHPKIPEIESGEMVSYMVNRGR